MNISGRVLARNCLLNLAGQALPLLVAVLAIPPTVRSLGTERFGLLSLAWVVLGYFTVFDLGLGRASTKHVAEALGAGDREAIPRIVWTVAAAQTAFGMMGALIVAATAPILAARVLKVPAGLVSDGTTVLYVLAAALPIMLLSGCFSGVLEALQRFDLINAVKVPSSIMVFVVSLLGAKGGLKLSTIVLFIVLTRLAALACLWTLAIFIAPGLRHLTASWSMLKRLLGFGGWVTLSSIVGPVLVYLDRFMVASLISMSAVALYTAPYEALSRLLIIPGSIAVTLFPSFSSLVGTGDQERARRIFVTSVKYLFLAIGPVALAVILFSGEILRHWLGPMFAERGAIAMQVLAAGFLVNSLAHIPFSFLQGTGRPDIPAKFHLLELPFHVVLLWVLISRWGITGAAIASTTRVLVDAILLFAATWCIGGLRWEVFKTVRFPAVGAALAGLGGAVFAIRVIPGIDVLPLRIGSFMLLVGLFFLIVWTRVLDDGDRKMLVRVVKP